VITDWEIVKIRRRRRRRRRRRTAKEIDLITLYLNYCGLI
jgi:hypothetical protein